MHTHTFITDDLLPFEAACHSDSLVALKCSPASEEHQRFQDLLRQYYLFSCCHWGCHGKEHIFERLAGRTVSHAIGAYRLIFGGYYDEALSLVRSIGEIANLLNLFMVDTAKVRIWIDADRKTRKITFGPQAVRTQLRQAQWMIPFDDGEYRDLCESVTHPTPLTSPNKYTNKHQPVLGALFQAPGFQLSSNRLYWALAAAAGPTAKLAIIPEEEARKLVQFVIALTELVTADGRDS